MNKILEEIYEKVDINIKEFVKIQKVFLWKEL